MTTGWNWPPCDTLHRIDYSVNLVVALRLRAEVSLRSQAKAMDIYDQAYVESLFDEMSGTYDLMNYCSSFGFSERWRRQFLEHLNLRSGMTVCDVMCGMGECWPTIEQQVGPEGQIIGIDFSAEMLHFSTRRRMRLAPMQIDLKKENALTSSLEDESVDALVCGFGIKTLSAAHLRDFAREIKRVLKPGGCFSIVEISIPIGWTFRGLYMLYLKRLIPVLGRLLLGNPENYRMLGIYTERFVNCRQFQEILGTTGLQTHYHEYFYGCATGVSGMKPAASGQRHCASRNVA